MENEKQKEREFWQEAKTADELALSILEDKLEKINQEGVVETLGFELTCREEFAGIRIPHTATKRILEITIEELKVTLQGINEILYKL